MSNEIRKAGVIFLLFFSAIIPLALFFNNVLSNGPQGLIFALALIIWGVGGMYLGGQAKR